MTNKCDVNTSCMKISVGFILLLTLVVFFAMNGLVNHEVALHIQGVLSRSYDKLESYAGWNQDENSKILSGEVSGASLETNVPSLNYDNANLSEIRYKLKKLGYEPAEDHEFKSVYIITPKLYPRPRAASPGGVARKTKVISCWNCERWFLATNTYHRNFRSCPYSECVFDGRGAKRNQADMLLIATGKIRGRQIPKRPPGQIWVTLYYEPPLNYNYPADYTPWASAFNWTFNYRVDSDIFGPVSLLAWRDRDQLLDDDQYLAIAKNKNKTAAWMVSHCPTQSKRLDYTKKLKKYIDVDIYGRCGDLNCPRHQPAVCERIMNSYKFYLAFENSFCKDYVTEKLFRAFQFRTHIIPVVRGGFDYDKYIPKGTYVNAAHFPDSRSLAEYLKKLGNDLPRYAAMLKEKDKLVALGRKMDWCDVCEKLHTDHSTKVIPDIKKWSHGDTCYNPTDLD